MYTNSGLVTNVPGGLLVQGFEFICANLVSPSSQDPSQFQELKVVSTGILPSGNYRGLWVGTSTLHNTPLSPRLSSYLVSNLEGLGHTLRTWKMDLRVEEERVESVKVTPVFPTPKAPHTYIVIKILFSVETRLRLK